MKYIVEDLYQYEHDCRAARKLARRTRKLAIQLEKGMFNFLTECYEVKHQMPAPSEHFFMKLI